MFEVTYSNNQKNVEKKDNNNYLLYQMWLQSKWFCQTLIKTLTKSLIKSLNKSLIKSVIK